MQLKISLIFLFLTISFWSNSQDKNSEFHIGCQDPVDSLYKMITVENHLYPFLIFSIDRGYHSAPSNFTGISSVILKDIKTLTKNQRKEIAIRLMRLFNLKTVDFFESCEIWGIFIQARLQTDAENLKLALGSDSFYYKDILEP